MRKSTRKKLWDFVRQELFRYSDRFSLGLRKAKLLPAHKDFFGHCSKRRCIRIQLEGDTLYPYHIIDTMAHELAHLRYNNHRRRWFDLHVRILQSMAEDDLYARLRKLMKEG